MAVGWAVTGARGEDEVVGVRCWEWAWGWVEGGLRYWDGRWSIFVFFNSEDVCVIVVMLVMLSCRVVVKLRSGGCGVGED